MGSSIDVSMRIAIRNSLLTVQKEPELIVASMCTLKEGIGKRSNITMIFIEECRGLDSRTNLTVYGSRHTQQRWNITYISSGRSKDQSHRFYRAETAIKRFTSNRSVSLQKTADISEVLSLMEGINLLCLEEEQKRKLDTRIAMIRVGF